MNINVPNFVNTALPERSKGKNVAILSQNGPNHNDPGFLSDNFPRDPPKLYITAESDDFDVLTLGEWRDEGFSVEYIPMGNGGDEYLRKLERLAKRNLGPCETFGIIGESCLLLELYVVATAGGIHVITEADILPRQRTEMLPHSVSSTTINSTTIPR